LFIVGTCALATRRRDALIEFCRIFGAAIGERLDRIAFIALFDCCARSLFLFVDNTFEGGPREYGFGN
jgi:hypothetical protein